MSDPFSIDYTDRNHLKDFEKALNEDDLNASHIISVNDWAPVHEPVRRLVTGRNRRKSVDDGSTGVGYALLRWPFLVVIAVWLLVLSIAYASVRFYVALYEFAVTWRGRRRGLREDLRASDTYKDWITAAKNLDDFLGYSQWRKNPKFSQYDFKTVSRITQSLRKLRAQGQADEVAAILQGCVKPNFAGTQSQGLYSQCYFGTKDLIEEYNAEVVRSLDYLSGSNTLPAHTRRLLFKMFSKNFGKTALCLSGGAAFSYRHFGVIKALLEADLLPNIISGTSGGGLVAAIVGTRTNAELRELLVPKLADRITACWEPFPNWLYRLYNTGARFDAVDWAERSSWFTMGSLTFREAYQRTGRILNVSTVPADENSPAILCNYITSPDCVIWSALLASAAVPGILNPVVLMMKTKKGNLVPYSFGSKWRDGSLRTDIPIQALNVYFNVNFTVVSQVNPHISLFMYAPRGTVGRPVAHRHGKGWRGGFVGSAVEDLVKLEIRKWLKLIKNLKLMPMFLNQDWSSVWLQKFDGSVTLWPKIKLIDFWYILSDPSREKLATMIESGEKCAFPKLLFIQHQVNIERAIERGRRANSKANVTASTTTTTSTGGASSIAPGALSPPANARRMELSGVSVRSAVQDYEDRAYHSSSSVDPREYWTNDESLYTDSDSSG